ncbi:uncharacterized protein UTRI_06375_B [Ustilago trichophora]|uniref:Flavin reductase like domain-containing protein n=1 Tax=Ustilago trichophora TaxID=86804 RepID=A0A5C3EPC8_9BASI|nr:uncharacterized protein UTRI_06375_B [Ustilago trichophora]
MLLSPVTATAASVASARATTSKVTLEAFTFTSARSTLRRHRTSSTSRAFFSTSHRSEQSQHKQDASSIADQIRAVMRNSAQPVTLVTTFLPPSFSEGKKGRLIHGATLSSFSSISLDPNLVCFSIKTPSKLAEALAYHRSMRGGGEEEEVDFVVNVLAESQAKLAQTYAVPGTPPYPHPNTATETEQDSHPLKEAGLVQVEATSLPTVKGALGSFGCQVVDSVDLSKFETKQGQEQRRESKSLLYIARVVHVYTAGQASQTRPLIYHRQKFVSTSSKPLT